MRAVRSRKDPTRIRPLVALVRRLRHTLGRHRYIHVAIWHLDFCDFGDRAWDGARTDYCPICRRTEAEITIGFEYRSDPNTFLCINDDRLTWKQNVGQWQRVADFEPDRVWSMDAVPDIFPLPELGINDALKLMQEIRGALCHGFYPVVDEKDRLQRRPRYWIEPRGDSVSKAAAKELIDSGRVIPARDALFREMTQTWRLA